MTHHFDALETRAPAEREAALHGGAARPGAPRQALSAAFAEILEERESR